MTNRVLSLFLLMALISSAALACDPPADLVKWEPEWVICERDSDCTAVKGQCGWKAANIHYSREVELNAFRMRAFNEECAVGMNQPLLPEWGACITAGESRTKEVQCMDGYCRVVHDMLKVRK